jgi:S-formylglutathione hydrolase
MAARLHSFFFHSHTMTLKTISQNKSFGGTQGVYSHDATETGCPMRFGVYLPPAADKGPVPVLYWLSGLTCTEENFIIKAGAQRIAAELGVAIVTPDTSPRGLNYPGDAASYDFGVAAGFYLDATEEPWAKGYRMYSYITKELFGLVGANFAVDPTRAGIFGHSMGGHGALTIGLKHPELFKSISAFSPIVSPTRCPWGEKALTGYLGADRATWADYDATLLVKSRGWSGPELLVDQGTADQFLEGQLKPELLAAACQEAGVALNLRMQPGYDHSYFFISTFIEDHLRHHAKHL